jgi:broad specificity phosphatase PhoE
LSCAAAVPWHPQRALSINGLTNFQGLGNRYVLLRPGETTYDAAGMLDTNPINKLDVARGLTDRGREQVHVAARRLLERGIDTPVVWYDSGARAAQTAEILGEVLSVPRTRLVPEYSFLSARGMGALDRGNATLLLPRVRAADSETSGWAPEEAEDGTPSDSIEDVFVRVRQAVSKIETQFSGEAVILVGDSEVLSTITAAACGVELEMHGR